MKECEKVQIRLEDLQSRTVPRLKLVVSACEWWLLLILQKLRRGLGYSTEPLEAAVAPFMWEWPKYIGSSTLTSGGVKYG